MGMGMRLWLGQRVIGTMTVMHIACWICVAVGESKRETMVDCHGLDAHDNYVYIRNFELNHAAFVR
jgi:hypothetical protein